MKRSIFYLNAQNSNQVRMGNEVQDSGLIGNIFNSAALGQVFVNKFEL